MEVIKSYTDVKDHPIVKTIAIDLSHKMDYVSLKGEVNVEEDF